MYAEPYKLKDHRELQAMVVLADYYCALPILSKSLRGPLSYKNIEVNRLDIDIAYKLRNAELFRECVVHLAGDWGKHASEILEKIEPELKYVVMKARGGIALKIAKSMDVILKQSAEENFVKIFIDSHGYLETETLPTYFRRLLDALENYQGSMNPWTIGQLRDCLQPLLANKLLFFGGTSNIAGAGVWKDNFLCAEVDDDELPWDLEQKDW